MDRWAVEWMRERGYLEDLDIDGTMLLSGWFKNWGRRVWTVFRWLRLGHSGGLL